MDYKALSREILSLAGGNENIDSFTHCMTRLRLNVNDPDKVDVAAIKQLDGVLGVVPGDQVQIVVGPGHSDRLDAAFAEALAASDAARDPRIQRFVIPPFTAVREVKARLKDSSVKVGAPEE